MKRAGSIHVCGVIAVVATCTVWTGPLYAVRSNDCGPYWPWEVMFDHEIGWIVPTCDFQGPDRTPGGTVRVYEHDLDVDGDVDMHDVARWQAVFGNYWRYDQTRWDAQAP